MAPPPQTPNPAKHHSRSQENGGSQQYGRSGSTLDAERSGASLRSNRSTTSGAVDQGAGRQSADTHPRSPGRQRSSRSRFSSEASSPHSSNASSTSGDSQPGNRNDEVEGNGSHVSATSSQRSAARPSQSRHPTRPSIRGTSRRSELESTYRIESRPSSNPLSVWNLGADYTRYFTQRWPGIPPPRYPGAPLPSARALPDGPVNPFLTPHGSASNLRTEESSDAEKSAFLLVDDRLAAPWNLDGMLSWPLFGDKKEPDDDMHMPFPDDDQRFKTPLRAHFRRENIVSTIGFIFMSSGLLFIFVALPVLSSIGVITYNSRYYTPMSQMPDHHRMYDTWATVNHRKYPHLEQLRMSLIDPDTPDYARNMKGERGDNYVLVFSDEFNTPNRTFYDGDDPYWFAPDMWYGATKDLEWYDPDAVTTYDGVLELRLDEFKNHDLDYRAGMLQSWNKLCFKGGIFEVSMSLPGPAGVMGFWPSAWTMGNLGRPGYTSTTDGVWPYTYQECDVGITPNQSSHDGLSNLPGQRLPSCTCPGEDHPTPGTGRGAPEIDIVEVGANWEGIPIATQSYQCAPFDIWRRPDYNFTEFPNYETAYLNDFCGGPYQQAVSATSSLNRAWYDGKFYQKYSFEYVPGDDKNAYILWSVGGEKTWGFDARAIGTNGNIQQRLVSQEPMSMILNLGYSSAWSALQSDKLSWPAVMRVDYVRWYQKEGEELVTCDPPGFETTRYIKEHERAYMNPNLTKWDDTGYGWPKHQLNSDC